MKKIILGIAAVLLLVVVALIAAPFLIPVETYKNQIREQVHAATGRDIVLAGDISLSLLPTTRLSVGQVAFDNAPWAEEPQMARLDSLQLAVDPWALISGELRIQRFVLERPVIHLAVRADGTPNWTFDTAAGDDGAAAPEGEAAAPAGDGGGLGLADLSLEDVRLVDGRVTYADLGSGARYELSAVNLDLDLKGLDQPFAAQGRVTYNEEELKVSLDTGSPRQLMDGQQTDLALDLDSEVLALNYTGTITNAAPRRLNGRVDLAIPSVTGLAAWAGRPVAARPGTLERLAIKGQVEAEGDRYAFDAESLSLDEISGKGRVALVLGEPRPALAGNLDLAILDVTPYMPPPTEDGADAGAEAETEAAEDGATAWSDDPLDLSGLKAADVDFDIAAEGIKAREITVGRSALSIKLKDGRLQADLTELNLYEGQGNGRVVADGSGATPAISATFDLQDVDAHPLLTDAAGFERLEGTGAIQLDVQGRGRSQKAIVENLNGAGAISFKNGAVIGLNLAAMVRNLGGAFGNDGEVQKTDFAELSGTFLIKDGILKNDDLTMLNPLLRVRGAGTANLPARTVDYRVTPKAVASLKGQGDTAERSGVAVPVIIEGPWHALEFRPDLKSLIPNIPTDPKQLEDAAKGAVSGAKSSAEDTGKALKETLKGVTGGGGSDSGSDVGADDGDGGAGGQVDKKLKDAEKAIEGLFGGD